MQSYIKIRHHVVKNTEELEESSSKSRLAGSTKGPQREMVRCWASPFL